MAKGKDFDIDSFEFEVDQFEVPEVVPEVPEDPSDFLDEMLGTQEVEISISFGGDTRRWNVKSPRVVELLKTALKKGEENYIESCLEIGDAVLHNASVQMGEDTLKKYFGGVRNQFAQEVRGLEAVRIKVDKALIENIPNIIKNQIDGVLRERITDLNGVVSSLKDVKAHMPDLVGKSLGAHIGKLEQAVSQFNVCSGTLSTFINKYKVPQEKGKIGEHFVFTTLEDNFKDGSFEDVSQQGDYSDIKAHFTDAVDSLIEVKNHTGSVPTDHVKRFWKNLEDRDIYVGCFLSLGAKIQTIGDYKIESNGGRLAVFMNVGVFSGNGGMEDGIKFAYFVTRRFAQFIKAAKNERVEESTLKQKIRDIFSEMEKFKGDIAKIQQIGENSRKIIKAATDSSSLVETLHRDITSRIERILQINNGSELK